MIDSGESPVRNFAAWSSLFLPDKWTGTWNLGFGVKENLISQTFAPALSGRSVRLESRNYLAQSKFVFWKRKHEIRHVGRWWKPLPQTAAFSSQIPVVVSLLKTTGLESGMSKGLSHFPFLWTSKKTQKLTEPREKPMRSKEHAAGGTICARLIPAKTICSLEFPVVGKGRDSDSGRVEGGSGGGHRRVYYSRDLLVGGGRLLMPVNYYLCLLLFTSTEGDPYSGILAKLGTTSHTWETGLAASLPPRRWEGQIGKLQPTPKWKKKISNWAGRWCLFYSIFLATKCPLSPCSFFDNYPQLKMGLESTCFYTRMTFWEAKPCSRMNFLMKNGSPLAHWEPGWINVPMQRQIELSAFPKGRNRKALR